MITRAPCNNCKREIDIDWLWIDDSGLLCDTCVKARREAKDNDSIYGCRHKWISYTGFNEKYRFCDWCNEKEFEDESA